MTGKIFFTSDLHFGHNNIIKFCNRPFRDAEHMDAELIKWWNNRVSEADTVYFLGDFAFAGENRIRELLTILNGTILIVPGNHDKKLVKTLNREPIQGVTLLEKIHEITIAGNKIVLCHFPIDDWNGKFRGAIHLHGHCHGDKFQSGERRFDVGWDSIHDFVSEDDIIDITSGASYA
jgi:calcineurin-like phosphoesterase family protein